MKPTRVKAELSAPYSVPQWPKLVRFVNSGTWPLDSNPVENAIRPFVVGSGRRLRPLARHGQNDLVIAKGRKARLFAGSELAGQRAAIVMSLVQSAKLHGHDPWAYLKDVLTRLPTQLNSRIDELLPHRWQPAL